MSRRRYPGKGDCARPRGAGGSDDDKDKNDYKKPSNKLEKGDRIDLDRFSQRTRNQDYIDPKTKWKISRERSRGNPHGGSEWKLYDPKGNRIGTLDKTGKFLRGG